MNNLSFIQRLIIAFFAPHVAVLIGLYELLTDGLRAIMRVVHK